MNKLIDLHTHTDNSEDSLASMESMCLEAINKNISIISFTDHIDYNPADTGYLFFNEQKYADEIDKMQNKYSEQLTILKGAEFDSPHLYKDEFQKINSGDYDILLGSVHLIEDKFVGDSAILERMSLETLFTKYYEQLLDLVQSGKIDVVAHFDFPKRYYRQNILKNNLAEEILKTMITKEIALEINTSPLRRGYHESSPDIEILKKYAALGGQRITIGSDAHTPQDIGADFNYAFKLIQLFDDLKQGYFKNREFISV